MDYVDTTVTTPHVLTETSNLLGQLPEGRDREGRAVLRALVRQQWQEKQRPSSELVAQDFFPAFGLTDTAVAEIDAGAHLVLTDDMPLWHVLTEQGRDAISFNHLRMANW